MVTKTVMMTQQNVEHPHQASSTQGLLSNSPPNSPVIVSATKLREEEKRIQMVSLEVFERTIVSFRERRLSVFYEKSQICN